MRNLRKQSKNAKPDPALGYYNGELRFWLGWAQEIAQLAQARSSVRFCLLCFRDETRRAREDGRADARSNRFLRKSSEARRRLAPRARVKRHDAGVTVIYLATVTRGFRVRCLKPGNFMAEDHWSRAFGQYGGRVRRCRETLLHRIKGTGLQGVPAANFHGGRSH